MIPKIRETDDISFVPMPTFSLKSAKPISRKR